MTAHLLLLARKTVRGHQFRLIYCESLFRIQRAVSRKSDPARVDWVTVYDDPVKEGALEFWTKQGLPAKRSI